jgi:hypothetical protein
MTETLPSPSGHDTPESSGVYGGGSGYDAASSSSMRGAIIWPEMDTRREISSFTRLEICRKARALCENMGVAGHLIECMADLLGYLTPLAATLDEEWNQLATDNFREKQSVPEVFDASGKFSFWEYQQKMNEAAFRDGDLLPILTKTGSGTARIATYEAHQIANPYGVDARNSAWHDGVLINPQGRHLRYSIRDPKDRTALRTVAATDCIYYGHFKKHGHVRPVSVLRGAINHLQDIGEIVRDVKYGIKVRNQIPLTLEHAAGSNFSSNSTQAIVSNIRSKTVPTTDGAGAPAETQLDYEEIMQGGNIPRLRPGQSLKALIDSAPHPNQLALLEWLVRDIFVSAGLNPEIGWNIEKLRGANNRLLNSKLQRWIGARLLRQRNFVRRFWVYHIACEIKGGRLPMPKDPAWWKVVTLPQESITADKGREGKLNIDLVANRMMSLQTFFALSGQNWLTEIRQIAKEQTKLDALGLAVADIARGGAAAAADAEEEDAADPVDPDEEDLAADDLEGK